MFKVMSEALAEFKMIFDILDWGNTGFLTAQQLSAIMKQYGYNHNEQEVQQMINVVDCDGTGHMGFSTFCAALCASMTITKSSRSL